MAQLYTLELMFKHYLVCFVILFIGGKGIAYAGVKDSKAHWFFVHALANAYISWNTISDVFNVFIEPEVALFRPMDMEPINYSNAIMLGALHVYHIIAYWKDIDSADIFHHFTFVPFNQIAIFWPHLSGWSNLQWGSIINMLNFFTCGLPGGLDYFLLGLTKHGATKIKKWEKERDAIMKKHGDGDKAPQIPERPKVMMEKRQHKRFQAMINVWLRAPGIISACVLCMFEGQRNWEKTPLSGKVIPWICFVLIGYNGIHYMEAVVLSTGRFDKEFKGTS
jgi:hypothetical protein